MIQTVRSWSLTLLVFFVFLGFQSSWGQTLSPGDLAIIGVGVDDEEVLIVALTDIPSGEFVFFTDDEWNGSNAFNTGEGFIEWVTPAISAGTVITLTTSSSSVGGTVTSRAGSFVLGNSGDGVFLYQTANNLYNGTPTPLAFAGEDSGDSGSLTGSGLTLGTTVVYFGGDNGIYTGTRTGGDQASYLSLIYNSSNWATSGTSQTFNSTAFEFAAANLAPTASAVSYTGTLNTTQTLTGTYDYFDEDGDLEGTTTFQWYTATDDTGTGQTPISGATSDTYVLQASDENQFIAFGVTPVALAGELIGDEVLSTYQGPISVVGTPSLTVTEVLSEDVLDGYTATLTLVNDTFADATLDVANFTLNNAPSGLTIDEVVYDDANNALLSLLFSGDFDSDITDFSITIAGAELTGVAPLTSNDLVITALVESLSATGTLDFGVVEIGNTSASQTFSLSGTDLQAGTITLAALSGFEYSIDDLSFDTTLDIAHGGGNLAATDIYVRFAPNATGSFNGNITIAGAGASTTQAVTGSGSLGTPTATAATSITATSFIANWDAVAGATSYEIDVYESSFVSNTTTETFTSIGGGTASSYNTRTWTGDDGSTWSAFKARTDQVITSGNDAITLRNQSDSYIESGEIAGNPTNVSFDLQQSFSGSGGQVTLSILHGASFGTTTQIGVFPYSATYQLVDEAISGITGPYKIRIDNNTAARPTIDNLAFTSSTGSFDYILQDENVGDVTSYEVTGLTVGIEYFYVVRAISGATTSSNSNEISVTTQGAESLTISGVLTEADLDGNVVGLTLVSETFADATLDVANFTLNNAPAGLTIDEVVYDDANNASLSLLFSGDFDSDITNFSITIAAAELTGASPLTSNDLTITALVESLVATATLDFGTQNVGTNSASQTFSLSGTDLQTGTITLAALSGFEYSIDDVSFDTTLDIVHGGGNLAATDIYVRFAPDAIASFDGSISIEGAGASTTQAVTGEGILGTPNATAATSISGSSFIANWDAVTGATSYEIDVYTVNPSAIATNLIISEYGEGNVGSQKYIEIFNGTGAPVDLANYELWRIGNGGSWPEGTYSLTGTLANNTAYVVGNNATDVIGADIYDFNPTSFNGDDAVGLAWNGGSGTTFNLIDGVGEDGADPGTGWAVAGIADATVDRILIRKSNVSAPTTNWTTSAGTNETDSQWVVSSFEYNDSSQTTNLGSHAFDGVSYFLQNENVGAVTSYEVTGLESDTEYFYVVRAILGANTSANSNEISATTLGPIVWSSGVWSNGTGPTIADNALIEDDYTTSGNLSANSLTIAATGSFTISSGDTVTLEGALINNATAADFVVGNNANLIQNTNVANTGDITVTRISAPILRLDVTMWSSPVSGQILKDLSPATLNNRFLEYDPTGGTDNLGSYVIVADPTTTEMVPAKGYAVRAPNNWSATSASAFTGTFVGVPNNGNYSMSVDAAGSRFYLVGNPYPSSLNLIDFYNSGNNHIGSTIYLYEHTIRLTGTGDNFATYNAASDTFTSADRDLTDNPNTIGVQDFQGDVKAGQGFFVEAAAGAGTINFTNAMRSNAVNNVFFRVNQITSENNSDTFKLKLTSPTSVVSEISLGFYEGASSEEDAFDSRTFATSPLFYSNQNNAKFAIQGKAWPINNNEVFNLGFKANTVGEYTIDLENITGAFVDSQIIFIHDQLTNTYHNLSESPYTFMSEEGTFDNRLVVVFMSILSNENPINTVSQAWVFEQNNQLMVSVTENLIIKEIVAFDLQGRKLYEANDIQSNQKVLHTLAKNNSVLILQIKTQDGAEHIVKTVY